MHATISKRRTGRPGHFDIYDSYLVSERKKLCDFRLDLVMGLVYNLKKRLLSCLFRSIFMKQKPSSPN